MTNEQIQWLKENEPEYAAFMAAFYWSFLSREDQEWAAARDCASAAQLTQTEYEEQGLPVPQIVFLSKRDWDPANETHPERGVECHFMNCQGGLLFDRFGNSIYLGDIRPGIIVDFGNGIYKIEELHSSMEEFTWMASPEGHHRHAYECHVNF